SRHARHRDRYSSNGHTGAGKKGANWLPLFSFFLGLTMVNTALKEAIQRYLLQVQMPGQYIGGEIGSVVKDHRQVRGKLCLSFADAYTLGMSHHGLQVLYTIMNNDPQWACERAFTPCADFEESLRRHKLPLYSLETFTPLREFDLIGFSL